MGAGLELRLAVLVRSLGNITELQEVRPGVLRQNRTGLVWDLTLGQLRVTVAALLVS